METLTVRSYTLKIHNIVKMPLFLFSLLLVSAVVSSPQTVQGANPLLLFVITNHPTTNIAVTTAASWAEETTGKSPTKASALAAPAAAVVTPQQPEARSSKSKPLAAGPAGHRRRKSYGTTAARSSVSQAPKPPPPPIPLNRRTRSVVIPSPSGGASHTRSLASSQLKLPAQAPAPQHPAHQPRHLAPSETTHPRPPASFPRAPGPRSSKTSLGFISTPLRKRPNGRRRPVVTRAPPRVEVHITKPAIPPTEPRSTTRSTQTSGFKSTSGLRTTTHILGYAPHTTGRLNPTSPPTSTKEAATTTQDLKLLRQTGVSVSPLGSSVWQHKGETLDTREFSPAVGAAPLASSSSSLLSSASVLSNRKNKPVASQWSLLSMSSGENQTVAMGSWTDPLEPLGDEYSSGSETFVYDLTELVEEGSAFNLYEFDVAYSLEEPTSSPNGKNEQSFNESEPHGAFFPVTHPLTASVGEREHSLTQTHFHDDSESLPSGSAAGSELSLEHSQDRLMPETVTSLHTLSQTYDGFPNNTSASGLKLKESSYTQAAAERLTFQPTPSLLMPSFSSVLVIQPTPSSTVVPLSPSALLAEEVFTKQIFSSSVPQMEHKAQISMSSLPVNPVGSVYVADITRSDIGLEAAKSKLINNLYPSTNLFTQMHSSVDFFPLRSSPAFPKTTSFDISHYSVLHLILPSLPSLSAPFTSPHAINLSSSSPVSPTGITPLYSNTLTPLSTSPPFWVTAVPLPPSAAPQQPSLLKPSSSQQAERRNSEPDDVVEPAHVPQSDSVSENFQPSLLSFLSPSSNLQRDFEATVADTASLLSLPHFSEAPTESLMPGVDGALLPAEKSSNETSKLFKSQSLDAQSHSFSRISPTPSGLSVENLASISAEFLSDLAALPAQSELPELNPSAALWPSSDAAGLSVTQLLVHSDQRDASDESHPAHRSDTSSTSLPTAGIWAYERTLALLQANIDRKQDLHPASLSAASSSSSHAVLSTQSPLRLDNLSITVSAENLRAATVTERMIGEETALLSSSPSPHPVTENPLLLAQTSSYGSQDRYTSSLTFNRDPLSLQQAISHLHIQGSTNAAPGARTNSGGSQALVDYDSAFNHPTSPLLNPSVVAPTQMPALHSGLSAQLGVAAPQHASGLDYTQHSGLTQANSENPSRVIHTHSSAHTHLNGSEDTSQRFAEVHVNVGGLQQQSSHSLSFAPASSLLSPSIFPSPSLAAPPVSSLYLSHIYPAVAPLSSFSTPSLSRHFSSRVALPAVSASLTDAEIGFLSPTWPTAGVNQPTTTQSPLDKYLQSLQRSTTQSVSQSTESVELFIPDSPASTLPDDKLKSSHSQPLASVKVDDKEEVFPQFANNSQTVEASSFVSGSLLSPEASSNLSAVGKLSHLSAVFDPADVVPKIHTAAEQLSAVDLASSAVSTDDNVTLDAMLKAVTGHQPNEGLNVEAALNTESFPAEVQTTSPCPTSEPSNQHSSAVSTQPTGALVIPNPLHSSGLNIPSATQASRSPTGSSIDAPNPGFLSGPVELPRPASDNHTVGSKYISKSNATAFITLKDSPSGAIETTNTTKATNATNFIGNASLEASRGNVTGYKPIPDLSENVGTKSNLTVSKPSLNSSPSMSNHSGNQSSGGFVNGAMTQDHSGSNVKDENINLSPVPPVVVGAHHFITTKNSSPTAPFKAVSASVNNGDSGGLKKATVYPTPGSPSVAAKPCQCKQRFHFTCLCGLSSGNSMLCSNKKL